MGPPLRLRPRDVAKIGQLVLADGRLNGRQIISKEWIETSTAPKIQAIADRFNMPCGEAEGEAPNKMVRTLTSSLREAIPALPAFFAACAQTAHGAASALLVFLVNNRHDLVDYQRARMSRRRVSSASAESVMNHVVNRRLSKHQQMRWSIKGAHCLLQTRAELLDGRLEAHFARRFPHFRTPELASS